MHIRFLFKTVLSVCILYSSAAFAQLSSADTSYISVAPASVVKMLKPGKPPKVTFQISGYYNIGILDLAANDNTSFNASDFLNGRNLGTRYGYGVSLTGKISLHKRGNVRLTVTPSYQRLLSNFVISESPYGNVHYDVFSGGLGIEDNFTPDRPFKPYIGFEFVGSLIKGEAVVKTDSTDFNLTIKNSFRLGGSINLGFEYAVADKVGFNLGMKFTHANILLRENKTSSNPNETYLNDNGKNSAIPHSGWKQFFFASIYGGMNFYIGMKNKK